MRGADEGVNVHHVHTIADVRVLKILIARAMKDAVRWWSPVIYPTKEAGLPSKHHNLRVENILN